MQPAATDRPVCLTRRSFLTAAAGVSAASVAAPLLGPLAHAARAAGPALGAPPSEGVRLPSAVFGGELQYFRMSPSDIPARLELCRRAAFNVIQTYVPWNVHEFTRGRIDFRGHTHPVLPDDHLDEYQEQTPPEELQSGGVNGRAGMLCNTNLVRFLEQCHRMGFAVILRPGPFISDEWRNGGLPDWFLGQAPPEAFAYGPDGTPLTPGAPNGSYPEANLTGGQTLFYFPTLSYASEYYLAAARRWLRAFARFVTPWLASRGGPVVAIQVDDETCFFYRFGPFEVDYNPAMLTRYRRAARAAPPRGWPAPRGGVGALRPAVTWQRFKAAQIGRYLATLRDDLRQAGVDVPITHEMELILAPPADLAVDAGAVLLNPELYPGGIGPETMPFTELAANAARAAQRNRVNVWSAEQESEILLSYLLLGEGVLGGIQFDYTDGVTTGQVPGHARFGRALRTAGRLIADARRRADVAVVWNNSLTRFPYHAERWGFGTDVRRAIEQHVPALATVLLRAGLAFDLLDVEAAHASDFDPEMYPTVFLAAADVLPREAQRNLVSYVRAGGRLVCWPAPPRLDENLRRCTILADACYGEPAGRFDARDGQEIELLGRRVKTWRGVQTYRVSSRARVIARSASGPCGYRRRVGRGEALLLGSWLAADWAPGRAGSILEKQAVPGTTSPAQTAELARQMARRRFGAAAANMVSQPFPGGPPQELLVYAYENQRRGGDVISGGALAYWDGQNVVGLFEVNTTTETPELSRIPHHPIGPATVRAARTLASVRPHVTTSDDRIQARLLDAPVPGVATVMAANRWPDPVRFTVSAAVGSHEVRLPLAGSLTLPPKSAILLPIGYPVGHGVTVLQAAAQLLHAQTGDRRATLELWTHGRGDVLVRLPAPAARVWLGHRRLRLSHRSPARAGAAVVSGRTVHVELGGGDHKLVLEW
jgi:beta-galactosidase GanA